MTTPVELSCLTPTEQMTGEDAEETASLREMLSRAEAYLKSFRWCPPIAERYLGIGIGGVVALFLFRLQRNINDTDEWLWVVEGDLPSAYFVTDEARNPESALAVYCEMMEEWADAVTKKSSLDEVFPVTAPATQENADQLRSRVKFLRERILPML